MNPETLKSKQAVVDSLVSTMKESSELVIVEYRGLSVAELSELRKSLKEVGATLSVYKNTLVQRANDSLGHEELDQYLSGSNAYVFSNDITGAPKVLSKFAKRHENLVLKAGLVEGRVVTGDEVKALAKIPGREGLISMFLSCLQAPIRSFACTVKAVADSKN